MHRKLSFLVLLLFISGFCSLVYQVAWIREFRLIFGASTLATSAVLAIFMGGLGIGAALFGGRAERSPNPLRLYALLEIGVTAGAALTPALLFLVRYLYIQTGGSMALGLPWATALRLVLATLVLAGPCILMGGNLPAAVKFIQTNRDQQRRALGGLYGINAMGAVLGSFLTTFWMLENLGTRESLYAACAANLVIGLLALAVSRKAVSAAAMEASAAPKAVPGPHSSDGIKKALPRFEGPEEEESPAGLQLAPFVYGGAFLCGFLFFLIELVWYRMLIPLLGGSVYAFGLILTVALFGLACGGLLYALTGPGRIASLRAFGLVSALQACAMVMPYALGDRIAIFAYHANSLQSFELTGQIVGWSLTASVIVLMPSVIAGFQFPLLVALLGEGNRGVGRQLGRAYAWNTFGAIAGALSGGFWLIPELSAPGCWLLVAALISLMSGAALVLDLYRERQNLGLGLMSPVTCLALAVACLFATGPTAAWRHVPIGYGRMGQFPKTVNERKDWVREMNRRMIYDFDGRESSIALVGTTEIAFFVNGKSDGSARTDAGTQVMLGLLPALLHPGPKNACVVGLGTGCTTGWLADVPGIERVDVIELEPGMRRIARDFGPVNRDVLDKENVRVIDGDAREVLVVEGPQYDLIASAPSNPYRAGVASLYTREYYQSVKARLAEDGLFAQWVQCYEIDTDSIRVLFATLSAVFESVDTWATQPNDFVFICSNKRPVFSLEEIEERAGTEPFAEAIRRVWFTDSVSGIFDRSVANSEFCREIAVRTPLVNTDNRNLLEFRFAKSLGKWTRFNPYDVAVEANARGMRYPPLQGDGLERLLQRGAAAAEAGTAGGPLDQLLLAERLAKTGRPEAEEMVHALAADWPVEAAVMRAQLAFRKKDYSEASRELLEAFRRYEDDPWPHQKVMRGALDLAIDLAEAWNPAAAPLFYAIEDPFCIHAIERERLPALMAIAQQMDANHRVRAADAWGPHFPWSDEFLEFRLASFQETGDSRSAEAERDYIRFHESEDSRFVLGTEAGGAAGGANDAGEPEAERGTAAADGLAKGVLKDE